MIPSFNERKPNAVGRMYEFYFPLVTMRVNHIVGVSPAAEDIVSKIFDKVLHRKIRFTSLKNIENYLALLVKTICRDHELRQKVRILKIEGVREYYQSIEDRAQRHLELKSAVGAIHYLAQEMLPSQCKEVFIRSFLRDMRNKEIAAQLGLSEKTVANQINIAIRILKRECMKNGGLEYFIQLLLPLLWEHLRSL
jgi:RNA polymerase sigma factor (sigma-70 family)